MESIFYFMKKLLIVIVGPTAVGKTSFAINIAQHYKTEILSADSRQFYKEMTIGTAKPNEKQLKQIPHHFINNISITNDYDAGSFENDAIHILNKIFLNNHIAILCGGSGMYVDAICKGFDKMPEANNEIRNELANILKQEGIEALQKMLLKHDETYYHKIDLNNPQRIIRALEVCLSTGKPYSDYRKQEHKARNFETIYIGLDIERNLLYQQIDNRVDCMMKEGFINEVEQLLPYLHKNALQTVGYKELFAYLNGEIELTKAVEQIKQHTRNFAKRQLTWFRKNKEINWMHPNDIEKAIEIIDLKMKK